MKTPLEKVKTRIDINQYSLTEYCEFFERSFNGKYLYVITEKETIKIKLENDMLPHLIGMQYCYSKERNKHKYKGKEGFLKLKNGNLTLEILRNNYRKNSNNQKPWEDWILPRIEWLPCFLNDLEKKSYLLCKNSNQGFESLLNGDYLLFRFGKDKYAILSIINVGQTYSCESFFYNSGSNYYSPEYEIEIKDIFIK